MNDDKPKSALELAMERLRQKDADSGVVDTPPPRSRRPRLPKRAISTPLRWPSSRSCTVRRWPASSTRPGGLAEEDYRREIQRLHDDLSGKCEKYEEPGVDFPLHS